jgi:hypothetical protein
MWVINSKKCDCSEQMFWQPKRRTGYKDQNNPQHYITLKVLLPFNYLKLETVECGFAILGKNIMSKKPKILRTLLWRYLGTYRKESCPHSWPWCWMELWNLFHSTSWGSPFGTHCVGGRVWRWRRRETYHESFEVLTVVLLNIQFLWEVNPYWFLEASLTVYRLTRPKFPETQHSGKFQSSVYITVPISDTLPVENVSGLFCIEGVLAEYSDLEVVFKRVLFFVVGTRLLLVVLSAILNKIFVFSLTGYKKDSK